MLFLNLISFAIVTGGFYDWERMAMAKGDHIRVWRTEIPPYWHHGIDCGGGNVIHFSGEPKHKKNASVRRTSRKKFAAAGQIEVVHHDNGYSRDTVVSRAERKLGEKDYGLVFNNCEHFARWCATGEATSDQVDKVLDVRPVPPVSLPIRIIRGIVRSRRRIGSRYRGKGFLGMWRTKKE
jgi:hypothetical protein